MYFGICEVCSVSMNNCWVFLEPQHISHEAIWPVVSLKQTHPAASKITVICCRLIHSQVGTKIVKEEISYSVLCEMLN
jgi:hypothetical protein